MFLCRHLGSRLCARLLAGLVFCGAFLAYQATLHPGFFPGESARQVAVALLKAPNTQDVHSTVVSRKEAPSLLDERRRVRGDESAAGGPGETELLQERQLTLRTRFRLWSLASSLVARHLPRHALPAGMNGLSACFGALSVALLFALMRSLLLLLSFHVSTIPSNRRKAAGTLAGLAAAAALGASVPFWVAATRCLPHTFEVFLLVAAGYLMLNAVVQHREWLMTAAGILLGASLFESEAGLWMAPLMLLFAARAIRTGGLGFAHGGVALFSGMVFGVMGYLALNWLGPQGDGGSSFMLPFRELAQNFRMVGNTLTGGWLKHSINVVVACFIILPLLASLALAIWGDHDLTGISTNLLLLTLLGTTTVALTGGSISPWAAYRASSGIHGIQLPCTLFLLAALVAGFLAGQGCLMAGGRIVPDVTRVNRRRARAQEETEFFDAPMGRLIMGYLCVLLCATGMLNFREILDWREPLSSQVAAETIRRLGTRRWVVADGTMNPLLRLHGRMAGRFVGLLADEAPGRLPPARLGEAILRDAAFAGVDGDRLRQQVKGTNPVTFVQALLSLAPGAGEQVLVLRNPDLWRQAGRSALPDVVGYRGLDTGAAVDWEELLQAHLAFWDRIEQLPPLGQYAPVWLRGHRASLRQQLHAVGTRLADELARAGRTEAAKTALDRANRIREEPLPASQDLFY